MRDAIAKIRHFNRFYTRFVGALDKSHLDSKFSLAEVRILYELAHAEGLQAKNLITRIGLDPGYLSRILKRFEGAGLVARTRSDQDGRAAALSLTSSGRHLFAALDSKADATVAAAIEPLTGAQQGKLVSAMEITMSLLDDQASRAISSVVRLRAPESGDFGWAIERHGLLYKNEFGWGPAFEGLVAELFGSFACTHDPARERCWIAELDGQRVGCVFVIGREPDVAQLRCLLVEPAARGRGVGGALVNECIEFAKHAGYRRMMLWTNKGLDSARKIYQAAGFELVDEQPHQEFGLPLVGQNWEMAL